MRRRQASQGAIVGDQCQVGWTGGYQWPRLSAGRPPWRIGLKFQCRGRIREVGESQRGLRRLKLLAGRVKFVPNGCRSEC